MHLAQPGGVDRAEAVQRLGLPRTQAGVRLLIDQEPRLADILAEGVGLDRRFLELLAEGQGVLRQRRRLSVLEQWRALRTHDIGHIVDTQAVFVRGLALGEDERIAADKGGDVVALLPTPFRVEEEVSNERVVSR